MSTSTTDLSLRVLAPAVPEATTCLQRRRRIDQKAGRALEILGHAIEYLTDEYVHEGRDLSAHSGPVAAVQLLMARNREIYFSCPEVPTLRARWKKFLCRLFA